MRKIIVAPSLLSANKNDLVNECKKAEDAKCEFIHFDVMDGVFVPNVSFSSSQLKEICDKHNCINDVHIMIENPLEHVKEYIDNGADYLTFHLEACKDENYVIDTINFIKLSGCKVGISIKPKTQVEEVLKYLDKVDLVLIMSVEPGFGGQKFISTALDKIHTCRNYIDSHNLKCLVEVDGGINNETGKLCKDAGADILVAGSYLYGHDDFNDRVKGLLN